MDYYLVFTSDEHQSEYLDEYSKCRQFLSGFTGSAGTLLVGRKEAILWTDGRYFIQAEKELEGSGILLYRMQQKGVPDLFEYLEEHLQKESTLCMDMTTISQSQYEKIEHVVKKNGAVMKSDDGFMNSLWVNRPRRSHSRVYELPMSVCGEDRCSKINRIREKLIMKQADGVLFSELCSIMWLFNIRGNDIAYTPIAFSYAYISQTQIILFLQKDCEKDIAESFSRDGISIYEYEQIAEFAMKLKNQKLLLDPAETNRYLYLILEAENEIFFIHNAELIDKYLKNEVEQQLAREYHVKDAVAMCRFLYWLKKSVGKESISEYEAAMKLDDFRRDEPGFVELSFETISAYKENAAIVHYSAKKEKCALLEAKGMLLVDSGAQYMGATTDVTRTIVLGEITEEERVAYTRVLKGALELSMAIFPNGVTGQNLDAIARMPLWKELLDYRHGTGHGIGGFLSVHEGPQAFRYLSGTTGQTALQPGMITSDEPGIYIENQYGIRLENALLCVKKGESEWGEFLGFDILTLVPFDLKAVKPELLTKQELDFLNWYHEKIYETISPFLNAEEAEFLREETRGIA